MNTVVFATSSRVSERKRDLDDEQTERLRQHVIAMTNEKDANQSTVAKALDVSPSTISSLISGRQGGSYAMAFEVARIRGVPLSDILGEETVRRIISLEPAEPEEGDPKRKVQLDPIYLASHPKVQKTFDLDDRFTSSSVTVTREMYMRRLLQIIDDWRAGILRDPDELKGGARLVPPPADPTPPKQRP